jgi:hypothetical protein
MPLVVGQAAYGERHKGHALLGASPSVGSCAAAVIARMDVQGTIPPGIEWDAYWSGFAEADFYVLARTAPDLAAERPGMVRSRALFVRLADIAELDRIGLALNWLSDNFDVAQPYDDIYLDQDSDAGVPHLGLVKALTEGGAPAVWTQADGFGEALKSLWFHLWPDARAALSFRQSFSPHDISDKGPLIATTPPALTPRWSGANIVGSGTGALRPAAALLAGHEAGARLSALRTALSARLPKISDLVQLEEVSNCLEAIAELGDGIAALRLMERLSPDPAIGRDEKRRLIQLCIDAFPGADAQAVRMARNLHLAAFPDRSSLWAALCAWSKAALWQSDAPGILAVLQDAFAPEGPVAEWRDAVLKGTSQALEAASKTAIAGTWVVLTTEPEMLRRLLGIVGHKSKLSRVLAKAAPQSLPETVAEVLCQTCAGHALVDLHAVCCAAAFLPSLAAARHIADLQFTPASLATSLSKASDRDIVAIALEKERDELFGIAAHRCAAKPQLLASLDVTDSGWRRLWRETLALAPGTWSAPQQPESKMAGLLSALMDAEFVDEPLLSALAATPLADLSCYSRRGDVWPHLPKSCFDLILAATAEGWIDRFIAEPKDQLLEQGLAEQITRADRRERLLDGLATRPVGGCLAFRIFAGWDEGQFQHWIRAVLAKRPSLDVEEAEGLGRVVAARSWNSSANALAGYVAEGREDLRPAMQYCIELVGWLLQYQIDMFWNASPADAKWRTLEELAVQLYGIGPGEHGLWERAGGKKSDIPNARTGGDAWRQVIGDIQNGKRKIDPRKLIQTMADDYPGNRTLQKMRWDGFYR